MFLRFLKSFLVIGAVIIIAVTATKAAWTDTESVTDNIFQAGNLDIAITPSTQLFDTSQSPIYPGWSETKSLVVTNSGNVPLTYKITATKTSGDDILFDSNQFLLKISTAEGDGDIYGSIAGSKLSSLATTGRTIPAGGSEQLNFTASLDPMAGNELKDKQAVVSFNFVAQ